MIKILDNEAKKIKKLLDTIRGKSMEAQEMRRMMRRLRKTRKREREKESIRKKWDDTASESGSDINVDRGRHHSSGRDCVR